MWQIFINTKYDFLKIKNIAYIVSGMLIIVSIVALVVHGGPILSVDFAGGVLLQLQFDKPVSAETMRKACDRAGLQGSEIQHFGTRDELLVRAKETGDTMELFRRVESALHEEDPSLQVTLRRLETVGPKIGKELRGKAIWAVFLSLLGILIYVSWRYEFKYAVGAVVALFHDVFVTLGLFTLADKEVSLTIVAALLTIAGFSVNDTIVIFDRIRELRRLMRRESLYNLINLGVNQCLSRTIITSFTVFLAVIALFLLGGEVIHDFAFAMLIGIVTGSYSTVFVASALVLEQTRWREAKR